MTCPHASSGCNYPEAHCLGMCDSARRTCATRGLVLTMPAGLQADPAALRREFQARGIHYNWHPSQDLLPGVLHLTCMHPEDLRAAGCTDFIERGWQGRGHPTARSAQRGHISLPFALHTWLLALMVGLLMGASHLLDGPSDHQAELDTAASASDAAEQQRRAQIMARICGGIDAVWQQQPDGSVQCLTKRNHKTVRHSPAAVASAQETTP